MNEAAVHDAATADEASTSMRVLGNAHAPVAQDHDEGPQQSAVREYVDQPCCTNCIISTALAVILCRKRCDPSRVISEFAFFPPEPPTYSIAEGAKEATVEQPGVLSLAFNYRELEVDAHFARFKQLDGAAGRPTCRLLFTGRKQRTPSFYFEKAGARVCVIYLHANASCRAEALMIMADVLACGATLYAFDFAGCGHSEGDFITLGWFEQDDVAAVIRHLRDQQLVTAVALWGRSMGASSACFLPLPV